MGWMELLFLLIMISLCAVVIKTDLSEGLVYNKTLFIFLIIGIWMDLVYYGFFCREMLLPFIINVIFTVIVGIFLFFAHCLAGGDCKLLIVLSLLYPARCYISYESSLITIIFTLGIAVFYGYLYLLGSSIYALVIKENKMSGSYVKRYLYSFVKSFLIALIYISAVTLVLALLNILGVSVSIWVTRIICIAVSWFAGRYSVFRKKQLLILIVVIDIIMAIKLGIVPISIHPENYILVVALLICQMMIRTNLYQEISIDKIKKGMILSVGTTLFMQNSRVRGLPKISSEDLRDRLTEDEIENIKRWANGRKIETVTIVKKIPFAIFISLGFISYICAWGLLTWVSG